jgi:hypothetical protein
MDNPVTGTRTISAAGALASDRIIIARHTMKYRRSMIDSPKAKVQGSM